MSDGALSALARLSDAIAAATARAAAGLTAIRFGPDRHASGFHWRDDIIVTSDQALPAQSTYSVVLSNGAVVSARPGPRDPAADLAVLLLDTALAQPPLPRGNDVPAAGSLVLALGACHDASPAVRMTVVRRLDRTGGAELPLTILDLPGTRLDVGGMVLNAAGELLGMARVGSRGEASVLPCPIIARFCDDISETSAASGPTDDSSAVAPRISAESRRGWLGVALQPITVPDVLAHRAGQNSARMVMSVTAGGPADRGGLKVGDVLLALNGHYASGPHALRAFLGAERIGAQIEVRLLRDGVVQTAHLTVAAQPAG